MTHRLGSSFPIGRQDVPVDVGGHADRRVTEDLTHDLEFHTLGQHQTRRRVAQFVGVPVAETRLLADRVEVSIQIPWIEWSPDHGSEDVVGTFPTRRERLLILPMLGRKKVANLSAADVD